MASFKNRLTKGFQRFKNFVLIILTPFIYGLHKLYKSLVNLAHFYKPLRSLSRALSIVFSLGSGIWLGAMLGTLLLPGIGTIIGAIIGGLCFSSIGAFLAKNILRGISWLAYESGYDTSIKKSHAQLVHKTTNPEKYSISKASYGLFCEFFNITKKQNTDKIVTLVHQLEAVKKAKNALGPWSSFWGTKERTQNSDYNQLLAEIKKDPIQAVLDKTIKIGDRTYVWHDDHDNRNGAWEITYKPG